MAINANDSVLRGVMREDFKESWKEELDNFKPSVDDEQYQFLDDSYCDCVLSKEDIEKLVALCEEDGYTVPRGLTREEKRMFILNIIQKEGER